MNFYECSSKNIFWGKRLIVQFNKAVAKWNGAINISQDENIPTIAQITFIIYFLTILHYFFKSSLFNIQNSMQLSHILVFRLNPIYVKSLKLMQSKL